MNQHLENILAWINSLDQLTQDQKATVLKAVKDADTELTITAFKLERTEKVKRTTAILLEETIQELEHKRNAVEVTNKALQQSLNDLKAAQTQLIHSEKMASLGELTAGIAHEIQNPLNFVNNFSEVSTELIDEMNEEIVKGNLEDATMISADLKENLVKINHHGKRAGEIVKSMLQHSRTSSGQKEPTDINALVDEYLRLAYHGFRAKDKSFNAMMKTQLDDTMPNINVIPQDIGRVVLNLITNAFYVVSEKSIAMNTAGNSKYEPLVSVSTFNLQDKVKISVTDNGNGIPKDVVNKIFQPFFSTKPTGKGTGLGLSLSYDIVTKVHGGSLEVITKEGEGSTFNILLPI
jgi:signal transduction histidine kinase